MVDKVGPIRTSIKCMEDYIEWYNNPNKQNISRTNTMVKPNNIGIKIKEYKKDPIICDEFNGKTLYKEDECNDIREDIRNYQISKNFIDENNTVGKGNFRKLNKNYFEKEGDLYKYSHNGSIKKLWKPAEITRSYKPL